MNEQQRLYLVQARSDWSIFLMLKNQPVCHRLHYLQMSTEKLAKAYFWKNSGAAALGHASFVKFIRSIATKRQVVTKLGFMNLESFGEWIKDVSDLAYELERLAPALANDGPNPEYPWPRREPRHAPIEHDFQAWRHFGTANGQHLRRLIEQALANFDAWF
ncbi:MAG: hypothetical protein ABI353_23775 [Isosphaeraceae bacterium]